MVYTGGLIDLDFGLCNGLAYALRDEQALRGR